MSAVVQPASLMARPTASPTRSWIVRSSRRPKGVMPTPTMKMSFMECVREGGSAALELRRALLAEGLQALREVEAAQVLAQHGLLVQQRVVARLVGGEARDGLHATQRRRA